MFRQKFIKIFHLVQEIGLFSLFQNLNLGNASANPKWQSLGLHLININAYAKFYQNIPNGLRVIDFFHEQAGDKMFTNGPRTKSSQTVRWQNQMFDYRALYEIQLQVSVDFLRVVQSRLLRIIAYWGQSSQYANIAQKFNFWRCTLIVYPASLFFSSCKHRYKLYSKFFRYQYRFQTYTTIFLTLIFYEVRVKQTGVARLHRNLGLR